MAKVAKPMSLRVKVQMQGLGLPSLCFNSTGLHMGSSRGTLRSCLMLLEWGGKACPLLKKGSVWSRLDSSCRSSSYALGASGERGLSVLSWAGLGTASDQQLQGREGSLWFVLNKGISSWGETSAVKESNSGM